MKNLQTEKSRCRVFLQSEKEFNQSNGVWPSVNVVIDRMIERDVELGNAYNELEEKLECYPHGVEVFLDRLLGVAALWNPEAVVDMRDAKCRLGETNKAIAASANKLAELLRRRSEIHNTSHFSSDTHYHVCEIIEKAAEQNYLFNTYVQDDLHAIRRNYDLKYWPSVADFVQELATDAASAKVETIDAVTLAATSGRRASRADFFRALFASLDEAKRSSAQFLPIGLTITDEAYASFANCALDLLEDELCDGPYVKRLRQRDREASC